MARRRPRGFAVETIAPEQVFSLPLGGRKSIDTLDGRFAVRALGPALPRVRTAAGPGTDVARAVLGRFAKDDVYQHWLRARQTTLLGDAVCARDDVPAAGDVDLTLWAPSSRPERIAPVTDTSTATDFTTAICAAYAVEGDVGRPRAGASYSGAIDPKAVVRLPMATMNRHGLIAGATGTGKTRTLQLIAEQLSDAGVSVFAADYKGDLSGLSYPGAADGPAPKRMADLGLAVRADAYPVEFLSLGGIGDGMPVRATVTDFGPELLGKVLGANETQEQVARAALPLRRRARARPRRPRRPAGAADLSRLRRGQGGPHGDRRRR